MEQEKSNSYGIDPDQVQGLGEATAEERAGRVVAKDYFAADTKAAAHAHGILYQGEFETPGDGTARAVRAHARALAATGALVLLKSFSNVVVNRFGVAEPVHAVGMPQEVTDEVGHLLNTDIATCRPLIKHAVIRSPEHLRQLLIPRGVIPQDVDDMAQHIALRQQILDNTIVYSVWERDRVAAAIGKQLAEVRQCWVPCEQNAHMLVSAGVPEEKVHVVPHPYDDSDKIGLLTQRPAGAHNGWKRFYSIGRWEPRKGFQELVAAFVSAYSPGDKATLTIKYSGSGNWPDCLTPEQTLQLALDLGRHRGWTADNIGSHVKLVGERLKHSQIVGLHMQNHIYVSASHGEAWGLPAFDAKRAGNRLVYIPWGGTVDFAEPDDVQVPFMMSDAHQSYRWEHGAQWASSSIEALAEALAQATPPASFAAPSDFESRFSMAAVGARMRACLSYSQSEAQKDPLRRDHARCVCRSWRI